MTEPVRPILGVTWRVVVAAGVPVPADELPAAVLRALPYPVGSREVTEDDVRAAAATLATSGLLARTGDGAAWQVGPTDPTLAPITPVTEFQWWRSRDRASRAVRRPAGRRTPRRRGRSR